MPKQSLSDLAKIALIMIYDAVEGAVGAEILWADLEAQLDCPSERADQAYNFLIGEGDVDVPGAMACVALTSRGKTKVAGWKAEEAREQRHAVMFAVVELIGTRAAVPVEEVMLHTGLTRQQIAPIQQWMWQIPPSYIKQNEEFFRPLMNGKLRADVEALRLGGGGSAGGATSVTYNIGQMSQSMIQHGSHGSSQSLTVQEGSLSELRDFVEEFQQRLPSLGLEPTALHEITRLASALEVRLEAEKPDKGALRGLILKMQVFLIDVAAHVPVVVMADYIKSTIERLGHFAHLWG